MVAEQLIADEIARFALTREKRFADLRFWRPPLLPQVKQHKAKQIGSVISRGQLQEDHQFTDGSSRFHHFGKRVAITDTQCSP